MSGGVLEIPAFVIGVAGIFTSCVDAFNYFKLYQGATRDIEVVLLKLDIEKARLLIWGENIGILSATPHGSPILNQVTAELIERILIEIQKLLTDSEGLRIRYGLRASDTSARAVPRIVDYISKKSLAIFSPSRSRWLARNASALENVPRGSAAARTKWAIHDREKFQGLVIDLAHFVDRLFELAKIDPEVSNRIIVEDIESIVDVPRLAIVEEAAENYPTYLEAARTARVSTEAGTQDRRTLEERLCDAEAIPAVHPGAAAVVGNASGLSSVPSEIQQLEKYFVLTSPCRRQQTDELCDVRVLGSQVSDQAVPVYGVQPTFRWDVSNRSNTGRNTIGFLVQDAIGIKIQIRNEVEYGILGDLLKIRADPHKATPEQAAFIHAKLPLIQVYVYCAPCVCLIHTAIELCRRLQSPFVEAWFRPDSRLAASCCLNVDRTEGLRKLSEWTRDWQAQATAHQFNFLATHLDMAWLDQRLEHLDYEQPYDFEESDDRGCRFLILGEADYTSHMVQEAPGRIPRATDIWHFEYSRGSPVGARTFAGRFIEHRPPSPATQRTQSGSRSAPIPTPSPATPFAQPVSRKRPASPSSSTSASRRPRYDDTASPSVGTELEEDEGESIARSAAEDKVI